MVWLDALACPPHTAAPQSFPAAPMHLDQFAVPLVGLAGGPPAHGAEMVLVELLRACLTPLHQIAVQHLWGGVGEGGRPGRENGGWG